MQSAITGDLGWSGSKWEGGVEDWLEIGLDRLDLGVLGPGLYSLCKTY